MQLGVALAANVVSMNVARSTMEAVAGKRLVIFGCGYVGAAVARWAFSSGLRVIALTRNPQTAVLLREWGFHTVVADLASEAWFDEIEGAPDFALNCVSSGGGDAEAYRHSYLQRSEERRVGKERTHG